MKEITRKRYKTGTLTSLNIPKSYHKNNTYTKINFHLAIYNIYMLSKLTKILISTKIKNNRYYVRGVAL